MTTTKNDTRKMCDFGCGRYASHKWEGKRLCWPCKQPLLMASTRDAIQRLAKDRRLASMLSVAAGVNVTVVDGCEPEGPVS